ncbi:MAG: Beta-lactamase class C-like and penicillin binding proteins (PBPs) superfamily [uncultured Sphingomonadaceae bacterium]|uniref:Beta-lactamase class C-like and penicillin binding proteins (PBPs) superfamily n=1 Tax=uncultured Sphingomonadaceae bacterium TaxID=169976 RepID=A0A6J4S6F4_9SPHN|nr:MAG: Beta-lactamase class C-like and penicillin binding proteins (PBPs) superfamily [uncultured Sphingomonadaceae bacterium]
MNKRNRAGAALLAGLALLGAAPAPALAQAALRAAAQRQNEYPQLRALARSYVGSGKVPGIVFAVGRRGQAPTFVSEGRVTLDRGAAAAGPDSLWRIYSMTKPVTGIAAMLLVEDGKLRLDQDIGDLIPAFRDPRVLVDPARSLQSRPAKGPITVRHLLTHTSGLGYSITTKGPLLAEYERLGLTPFQAGGAAELLLRYPRAPSLQAFADRAGTVPLLSDPGTRWSYSMSLDVLGRVIEVASGVPFDRFLEQRLFRPLGMTSTYFTVPQAELGRFATNYVRAGNGLIALDAARSSIYRRPPAFPYGGAGLVSSARDYDRFLAMLHSGGRLDGVRVMRPETVRLAMSNLLSAGVQGPRGGSFGTGGFGAGGIVALADQPTGQGAGSYGWGGAAGTIAWVDPKNDARVTAMINIFPPELYPLRRELEAALYADLKQ